MKTSTMIVIGVAALGGVYLLTRSAPKAQPRSSTNSAVSALGGLVNGFASLAKTATSWFTPGTATSIGPSLSDVYSSDAANIDSYDAQGTDSQPVYGISGLDF